MNNLKTHKIPQKAGITDLKGFLGDMATEWWTAEDWDKWNKKNQNETPGTRSTSKNLKKKENMEKNMI